MGRILRAHSAAALHHRVCVGDSKADRRKGSSVLEVSCHSHVEHMMANGCGHVVVTVTKMRIAPRGSLVIELAHILGDRVIGSLSTIPNQPLLL